MNQKAKTLGTGVGALLLLLSGACSTSQGPAQKAQASPSTAIHTYSGGCAGTVLTDAEPPLWAQGGWTHTKGAAWPVAWAFGTTHDSVAYLFATQLVAGTSPRSDGSNNKVLWVVKDYPSGANVTVEGRMLGRSEPAVTIEGGPSIVDVPTPGCWTFQLSWSAQGRHTSVINLQALPAGSVPLKGPGS
jgi:hypothetical protein